MKILQVKNVVTGMTALYANVITEKGMAMNLTLIVEGGVEISTTAVRTHYSEITKLNAYNLFNILSSVVLLVFIIIFISGECDMNKQCMPRGKQCVGAVFGSQDSGRCEGKYIHTPIYIYIYQKCS